MEVDFESLVSEGQKFLELTQTFEKNNNPPSGTAGYLVSQPWLEKYKKFIFFDSLKYHSKPTPHSEGENVLPGKITNSHFLELDQKIFLHGNNGTGSHQESACYDRYIKQEASEARDFEVVSAEIWEFISTRYQYDFEVKRYYYKGKSWLYTTSLEITMARIPLLLVQTDKLASQQINSEAFPIQYVQVRKTATYTDLKKRIAECVSKITGQTLKDQNVRIWSASTNEECDALYVSLQQVAKNLKENTPMTKSEDVNVEENTGIECPGKSLEPYVNTLLTLEEKTFVDEVVLVEVSPDQSFVFKYTKQERVFFGKCEWCLLNKQLNAVCKCKRVKYCDDSCMEKDQRFHLPKCSALADNELNTLTFTKKESARNGVVGLTNLGNTCYMNSSLQCLSNTYELTKFFLEEKFKYMMEIELKNPLGTEGRLVMAYAKTLNEMWNGDSNVVTPDMFKRILGQYATQFQGFGQHDSHECINTVLDFLGEDLYRKGKKPYIDMDEPENLDQEAAAQDAWNRHLYRNESIITDLFHGQFKSTVCCSQCPKISITFDPMMSISLPIPLKKQQLKFFFVPYHIGDDYINNWGTVTIGQNETFMDFRNIVFEKYGKDISSYTIVKLANKVYSRYYSTTSTINQYSDDMEQTLLICYEIQPTIQAAFPSIINKCDSNNGVSSEFTRLVVGLASLKWQPYSKSYTKDQHLPRMMWVNKKTTATQLHLQIFSYFRQVLAEWIDYMDPNSNKPKDNQDLKQLINFPYRIDPQKPLTKAEFMSMSLESCFELCFKGLIEKKITKNQEAFDLDLMPYHLVFKDISGYMENCHFCGNQKCGGCTLPYKETVTVADFLKKVNVDENNTLFSDERKIAGKEFQVTLVWHQDIQMSLLNFLVQSIEFSQKNDNGSTSDSSVVTLTDCIQQFRQSDTLDQDNMWYCNKCQEHVQATKTLEIFKLPRIMIISLKRFKAGKSRYGILGGGSQKLDTLVDFPLEGLDMSPYVLSQSQNSKPLIYDLFAVSNHYGGVGGGHYTAYGQNALTSQWYSFNDSSCQPVDPQSGRIVSEGAYNLFYRLRNHVELNNIDFSAFRQQADGDFLKQLKEHELAKAAKKK